MNDSKQTKSRIGKQIKKYRQAKELTQAQLAEAIGKTVSSIQKYESGVIDTPISVLEQIADILSINWIELLAVPFDEFQKEVLENDDIRIFNELLHCIGYGIQPNNDNYALTHTNGLITISKNEVLSLLASSKEYLDFNVEKLIKAKITEDFPGIKFPVA
jgi:transcriptional regulator with XRE-family HTH domain